LINKKLVTERETASYKLDRATVELVRVYSEFIGSPQEHVVNESLLYIFRKDKDFNEWLKLHNKADLLAAAKPRSAPTTTRGKPRRRPDRARRGSSAEPTRERACAHWWRVVNS
jgi:hypothetical protein